MAGGAFLDTNEIQAGLDIARHLAIQKIQNDFACRRGLPIPRADGRSRHNYDDGQACFIGPASVRFRPPRRARVVAEHPIESKVGISVVILRSSAGDCGHCYCVTDSPGALALRSSLTCARSPPSPLTES